MANLAIFPIANPDPRRGRHLHWLAGWGDKRPFGDCSGPVCVPGQSTSRIRGSPLTISFFTAPDKSEKASFQDWFTAIYSSTFSTLRLVAV